MHSTGRQQQSFINTTSKLELGDKTHVLSVSASGGVTACYVVHSTIVLVSRIFVSGSPPTNTRPETDDYLKRNFKNVIFILYR